MSNAQLAAHCPPCSTRTSHWYRRMAHQVVCKTRMDPFAALCTHRPTGRLSQLQNGDEHERGCGLNGQVAMSALGSGRACSLRLSLPNAHAGRLQPMQIHQCALASSSVPEWLGLRPLGLHRVRRTSWSGGTPDLGAHWPAPRRPSRSGSTVVRRSKTPVGTGRWLEVGTYIGGTAPIITLFVPGTPPENHPPTEACMIHSKQHRGCGVQDPGTRGYRWWKTADFAHSTRTAHGAPPYNIHTRGRGNCLLGLWRGGGVSSFFRSWALR